MKDERVHGRIRSFRGFLLELGTITIGVLIALSLEGVREQQHYRSLVRVARQTIAREVADNSKDVENTLAAADERGKNLDAALRFANDLLKQGTTEINELNIGFSIADLSTASWQSAERTGALSHMDYAEVQEYSRLYGVQDLFAAQQRRSLDRMATALALLADQSDPTKAAPRDLEVFRQQLLALRADLFVQEQIGRRLVELYKKALARTSGVRLQSHRAR